MKKPIYNIFISCLISAIVFSPKALTNGCANEDLDDFTSFFSPESISTKNMSAFYFSLSNGLVPREYDGPLSPYGDIAAEWKEELRGENNIEDIKTLIFDGSLEQIRALKYAAVSGVALDESIADNSLAQNLVLYHNMEVINYLDFAKSCEPLVADFYSWDNTALDKSTVEEKVEQAITGQKRAKDDFIKDKYQYQIIRLLQYGQDYKGCIKAFDYFKKRPVNIAKQWSQSHMAGALMSMGKTDEANYNFVQLFMSCPSRRNTAFTSANLKTDADLEATLKLCQTTDEKCAAIAMKAVIPGTDGLKYMEQMREINSETALLELVMSREINKCELVLGQGDDELGTRLHNNPSTVAYMGKLQAFAQVMTKSKSSYKGFWHACNAIMFYYGNNIKEGAAELEKAKKHPNAEMADQIEILEVLFALKTIDYKSVIAQNDLAEKLTALNQYTSLQSINARQFALDQLGNNLAQSNKPAATIATYLYEQDPLFFEIGLETEKIKTLKNWVMEDNHNDLENYLIQSAGLSYEYFVDLEGTSLLRKFKFEEAAKILKQIDDTYWNNYTYSVFLAANPFATYTFDTHQPMPADTVSYNKYSFAVQMAKLKKQAAQDPAQASKYYEKYANGLYNMSYYGNSWMMAASSWGSTDWLNTNYDNDYQETFLERNDEYYTCKEALKYYKLAANATNDQEKGAYLWFMAAKCEQKAWYNSGQFAYDIQASSEYTQAFNTLMNRYANTGTYSSLLAECDNLRFYVFEK